MLALRADFSRIGGLVIDFRLYLCKQKDQQAFVLLVYIVYNLIYKPLFA